MLGNKSVSADVPTKSAALNPNSEINSNGSQRWPLSGQSQADAAIVAARACHATLVLTRGGDAAIQPVVILGKRQPGIAHAKKMRPVPLVAGATGEQRAFMRPAAISKCVRHGLHLVHRTPCCDVHESF
jgi:hypothetical protein